MLTQDFGRGVAVNAFRARIPRHHSTVDIQKEYSVILDPGRNLSTRGFAAGGLVMEQKEMAHRQDVAFYRVLHLARPAIGTDEAKRSLHLPAFQKGLPKLGYLGFKAGLGEVVQA